MKKLILLFGLTVWAGTCFPQNRISGKITSQDKEPMPGATIFIHEMNKGTISRESGEYELTNLPNGKLKIQFSFLGFVSQIETVDLAGESIQLNIMLKQSPIEVDEVVVSGGYNSTQHENAVKIESLKLDPMEIKSTPDFTGVLTRIPGVDRISKGNGISKPVIRGLSMNDILVLNHGVRFENYQYSSHHPLGIDEFGIADIEVIKGPASLLYGSDAIGGVINFIKEKPAPIGTVEGDYHSQYYTNSRGVVNNLGIRGASKRFFGGIRIGQKSHADFLQGGGEFVPNSRFNEYSLKANTGFTDQAGTFKLYYDYNRQKLGLVEEEAFEGISARGRNNRIFYQQFNTHLLSSQNKLYLGRFKLDLNAAMQNTELKHAEDQDITEIQMRLATLTYEAKLYLPSDHFSEYIIGFQGLNQNNTNLNNREILLLPDAQTSNYSLFGLLQRTFFRKLKLQTGMRYDRKSISTLSIGIPADSLTYRPSLDKNFGSFSGSIGATYNLTEELLFRTNLAAGYRTPNLAELTSKGQHELRFEIGNATLVPENSTEADISMHLHKENFTFDLAGFYNRISNYIFIAPTGEETPSGIPVYRYDQSDSGLYGGEAGLHLHPRKVKWLHLVGTFATVTGRQENGDYLPFIPASKVQLEFRAEREKLLFFEPFWFFINTQSAFDQKNPAPEEFATPGYTLMDSGIGGKFRISTQTISVSIQVSNLFDKKYADHLSTLREAGMFNPGRNISFNLSIPFRLRP